jgi:hypothetical protein
MRTLVLPPSYLIGLLLCLAFCGGGTLSAQWMEDYLGDESVLYAETKQINQFFRRFNAEEGIEGNRFYPGDRLYHDRELREKYLNMLFDASNPGLNPRVKEAFIEQVMNPTSPVYLEFHGGDWFAEVTTTFSYRGQEEKVTLFLQLEQAKVGSKWVFSHVYFEPFAKVFAPKDSVSPRFIHPMSHELDFMNLIKVFRNQGILSAYAQKDFYPDHLTLLLYEVQRGNLRFRTVNEVNFHFFQVDNWYFELSEFEREGYNRGWLIAQMTRLQAGEKDILLKYIYQK